MSINTQVDSTTEDVIETTYKWKIWDNGVLIAEIQFMDVFAEEGNVQSINSSGDHYKSLGWDGKIPLVFHRDNRKGSNYKVQHLSDAREWAWPSHSYYEQDMDIFEQFEIAKALIHPDYANQHYPHSEEYDATELSDFVGKTAGYDEFPDDNVVPAFYVRYPNDDEVTWNNIIFNMLIGLGPENNDDPYRIYLRNDDGSPVSNPPGNLLYGIQDGAYPDYYLVYNPSGMDEQRYVIFVTLYVNNSQSTIPDLEKNTYTTYFWRSRQEVVGQETSISGYSQEVTVNVQSVPPTTEDPDESPSLFAPFQTDVCYKEPSPDPFVDSPNFSRICPTCIENPTGPDLDWREQPATWLDERTCEYVVRVLTEESFTDVSSDGSLTYKYVRQGLRRILADNNKIINDEIICANPPASASGQCGEILDPNQLNQYKRIEKYPSEQNDGSSFTAYYYDPTVLDNFVITNPGALELFVTSPTYTDVAPSAYLGADNVPNESSPAYVKVSIPANLINILPDDVLAIESEQNASEISTFDEVIISGKTAKRIFNNTLPTVFSAFAEYQAFDKHVNGTTIRIKRTFDPDETETKKFYVHKYVPMFSEFYGDLKELLKKNGYKLTNIRSKKRATQIKIVFNKTNPTKPFNIKSVSASYKGCPFKKCRIGIEYFREKYNKRQTFLAYVATYEDQTKLIDRSDGLPPWYDYLVDFTAPAIEIHEKAFSSELAAAAENCIDNTEQGYDGIFSDFLLESVMSFSFALEFALNSLQCQKLREYDASEYTGFVNTITGTYRLYEKQLEKSITSYQDYGVDLYNKNPITKVVKAITQKSVKERKGFLERLLKTPLTVWFDQLNNGSTQDALALFYDKVNPCNWDALVLELLQCMMKGMQPNDILKQAIRASLGGVSPDVFYDLVVAGLPQDSRDRIENELRAVLGDTPWPWDWKQSQDAKKEQSQGKYYDERNDPDADAPANPMQQEQMTPDEATIESYKNLEEEILFLKQQRDDKNNILTLLLTPDVLLGPNALQAKQEYLDDNNVNDTQTQIEILTTELQEEAAIIKDKENELKSQSLNFLKAQIDKSEKNIYEQKAQKAIKIILDAYIELILEEEVEILRSFLDSLPGANVFMPIIGALGCPHQGFLKTYMEASISNIDINPCSGKRLAFTWPEIPMLPNLGFLDIMTSFVENLIENLLGKLLIALVGFLTKSLQKIVADLCSLMDGIGARLRQISENPSGVVTGNGSIFDAIANAFCNPGDDAGPGRIAGFSDSSLNTLGALIEDFGGRMPTDQLAEWGDVISQNVNVNEFVTIFIGEDASGVSGKVWEAIQSQLPDDHPAQAIFTSEQDVEDFLISIGDALTEEQKQQIRDYIDSLIENSPIITYQHSLYEYCLAYCPNIEIPAYTQQGGSGNAYDYQQFNTSGDFQDILRGYLNGNQPELDTIIDDVLGPNGADPFCQDLRDSEIVSEIQGAFNNMRNEPEELQEFRTKLSKAFFDDFEISYISDMIAHKHSFFNNLLADTEGARLHRGTILNPSHEFRVSRFATFPNSTHTVQDHNRKIELVTQGPFYLRPVYWLMKTADFVSEVAEEAMDTTDINNPDDDEDDSESTRISNIVDKVKDAFGAIKGVITALKEFFTQQPDPKNNFPETVGLQYLLDLEEQMEKTTYKSTFSKIQNATAYYSTKQWLSLGFTSENVLTVSEEVITPDFSITFDDGRDLKITVGYSLAFGENLYVEGEQLTGNSEEFGSIITILEDSVQTFFTDDEKLLYPSSMAAWIEAMVSTIQGDNEIIREVILNSIVEARKNEFKSLIRLYYDSELSIAHEQPEVAAITKTENVFRGYVNSCFIHSDYTDGLENNNPLTGPVYRNQNSSITSHMSTEATLFDNMCSLIFKSLTKNVLAVKEAETELPYSFRFGYDYEEQITGIDLTYVNPEATSDPSTWYYDKENEQKILGKSATGNQRVLFLDPEIYGGSYKKPKIYIKEARYTGWLDLLQVFVPEEDGCDPKREGWLFTSEIQKRVDDVEKKLTRDERLNYDPDCINVRPYDLVADVSTHAYLEGIVMATIRTYIVETILKTMPVLNSLMFSEKNFDEIFTTMLINIMKTEMMDSPELAGGEMVREKYYYCFLEQIVQCVERRIIAGEITKNDNLRELFNQIKNVRNSYHNPDKDDKKFFRNVSAVKFNAAGEVVEFRFFTDPGNFSSSHPYWNKAVFMVESVAFDAFGKQFKQYLKNKTMPCNIGFFVRLKKLKLYTKIYKIYQSESVATQIASYFILNEIDSYKLKLDEFLRVDPYIQDMSKFILNPESGCSLGFRLEAGKSSVESRPGLISNEEYGDVFSVCDNMKFSSVGDSEILPGGFELDVTANHFYNWINNNPLDDDDNRRIHGSFFVEKYFIFGQPKATLPHDLQNLFSQVAGIPVSPHRARGLLVKLYQGLNLSSTAIETATISDYFGDAELRYNPVTTEAVTYVGSTGLKFGVRLCFMPPPEYSSVRPNFDPLTASQINSKKSYYFFDDSSNLAVTESSLLPQGRFAFPIAAYQQDVYDKTISALFDSRNESNLGENLKCYIDKLTDTENYRFLINFLLPTNKVGSVLSAHCYYGFVNAVGQNESERENTLTRALNSDTWKTRVLRATKEKCRKTFADYYKVFELDRERGEREESHKRNWKAQSMPKLNMNLGTGIKWWQRKRFVDRPFSSDGRECRSDSNMAFSFVSPSEGSNVESTYLHPEYTPPILSQGQGSAPGQKTNNYPPGNNPSGFTKEQEKKLDFIDQQISDTSNYDTATTGDFEQRQRDGLAAEKGAVPGTDVEVTVDQEPDPLL